MSHNKTMLSQNLDTAMDIATGAKTTLVTAPAGFLVALSEFNRDDLIFYLTVFVLVGQGILIATKITKNIFNWWKERKNRD